VAHIVIWEEYNTEDLTMREAGGTSERAKVVARGLFSSLNRDPPSRDGSPSTGALRVYEACCNSQRFADTSRQARLPIQDELTLALVGRVSRSLIKVERPHRRETQGRLCKHKEVEHEPNHIGFLARGCPRQGCLWD